MNTGGGSGASVSTTTTSYIWDLRAEQHPLSEITCRGSAVWELAFHPRQPQFLYLATEEAGLVRIQSASSAGKPHPHCSGNSLNVSTDLPFLSPLSLVESWSFLQSCQKKLSATYVTSNPSDYCSVTTFDISSGLIVAGRDNCALQTIKDSSVSVFSCA